MEKFSLSREGGEATYRYLSIWTSEDTSSLLILEELSLRSYMVCQTRRKGDTDIGRILDRLIDENGRIHCSLLMGKARVAPQKTVTIRRLGLTAAAVSARVANMLKEQLDYEELQEFY